MAYQVLVDIGAQRGVTVGTDETNNDFVRYSSYLKSSLAGSTSFAYALYPIHRTFGHCCPAMFTRYLTAIGRLTTVQCRISANNRFLIRRMRTRCPLPPFAPSDVKWRVLEWSRHPPQPLRNSNSGIFGHSPLINCMRNIFSVPIATERVTPYAHSIYQCATNIATHRHDKVGN